MNGLPKPIRKGILTRQKPPVCWRLQATATEARRFMLESLTPAHVGTSPTFCFNAQEFIASIGGVIESADRNVFMNLVFPPPLYLKGCVDGHPKSFGYRAVLTSLDYDDKTGILFLSVHDKVIPALIAYKEALRTAVEPELLT